MKYLHILNDEEKRQVVEQMWENVKMQDYVFKKYDFYKTNDNIIIEIERANSLPIIKTIWYYEGLPAKDRPTASYENFILENIHHCNRFDCYSEELKRNTKFYFCNQGREMTEEEKKDFFQLYKERKEAYLKRLERYFKRYSKHNTLRSFCVQIGKEDRK